MALPALLLLENEEPFPGFGVGEDGIARGVMVPCAFTAGIPDLLTDPSYTGKLVCFTYPHIGTSGVVPADLQSDAVAAMGIAAKEIGRMAANRLGEEAMSAWLTRNKIPAIEGLDTRSDTGILARRGLVRAVIGVGKYADAALLAGEFANAAVWEVAKAGTDAPYDWKEGGSAGSGKKIVVVDFGVKKGFLRRIAAGGRAVRVMPSASTPDAILAEKPDGVIFSAGNGTPGSRSEAMPAAGALLGKVPLWGIGVGAGLLAEAAGARSVINGCGHYGVQPVGRPGGASGEMTVQAHDFWIEGESLAGAGLEPTHVHLNDGSVEGFRCRERRLMGTLFHPESEPGPHDSLYCFDRFSEMLNG
jgi:carbamoyl-phosphate synthase small subunit